LVYNQTCIKRSPLGQRKSGLIRGYLLRGSIHVKFSMTGQEKGNLLIQVTAWAGLTVFRQTVCIHQQALYINIMDLVCYTNSHWFFNYECQHIFGKQTGYIFQSPKNDTNMTDKKRIRRNNNCILCHVIFHVHGVSHEGKSCTNFLNQHNFICSKF
jgi:hypothetical protein